MKKNIGEIIKEFYPQSSSVTGLPVVGLMLLAINITTLSDFKNGKLLLTIATYLGFILIGLFLLIVLLETISKIIPSFRKLVQKLILIPQFFSKIYVHIVKMLIKNSVVQILEEKSNIFSENFILRSYGKERANDDYWEKTINFSEIKSLELTITPSKNTHYWRIGLKFSQFENFTTARYGVGFPLFHLTKDLNDSSLKYNYYSELSQHAEDKNNILLNNYQNNKVYLKFEILNEKNKHLLVEIKDEKKKKIFETELLLNTHRYAQLFAWGDGREYEINVINSLQYI